MSWNPDQGFQIEAPVNRQDLLAQGNIEFGKIKIIRKTDKSSIRLFLHDGTWAFSPSVALIDRDDVIGEQRLSIRLNRVVFLRSYSHTSTDDYLTGVALYEVGEITFLSDQVQHTEEVKIAGSDTFRNTSFHRRGIYLESESGHRIIGRVVNQKHLKIEWELPKATFSKPYNLNLAEAIGDSLSILLGRRLVLLQAEFRDGKHERIDIRRRRSVEVLDLLSPIEQTILNKEHFMKLVSFIAAKEPHSDICRNIFQQLLEASRQKNWQVTELLVSTILEAALRNIDDQPFQSRKGKSKTWKVGNGLKNFLNNYFSEEWQDIYDEVIKAHTYLRDRNAHPDWLFTQGGMLSEAEQEKSLDNVIFLSRFYGYMILAIAGFRDLEPLFPKSHTEWSPLISFISAQ